MIEVLHKLASNVCCHCHQPITLYSGDLTGERWFHDRDGQGTQFCLPVRMAEPVAGAHHFAAAVPTREAE